MVNNHGDRQSPKDRVVGPLPNGRTSWLTNGGDPNHLQVLDDPPSGCSLKWGPLKKKPLISHQIKESIGRDFFLGLLASETIFRRTFWSLESLEYCTSTGIGIEYEMLFMRYFDILNPQNHVTTVGVRNLAPVVRVGHLSSVQNPGWLFYIEDYTTQ